MRSKLMSMFVFALCSVFVLASIGFTEEITVEDIIKANIKAVSGNQSPDSITRLSFTIKMPPPVNSVISRIAAKKNGIIKLMTFPEPLIESITLFDGNKIAYKKFSGETEPSENDRMEAICLAPLYCGGFTLAGYKDNLKLISKKKYGLDEIYILEAKLGEYTVRFNLDASTFLLNSMEYCNNQPGMNEYKVSLTFRYRTEKTDSNVPESIYIADLGAGASARGSEQLITDFTINPELPAGFFQSMDLNFGTVNLKDGLVTGNSTLNYYVPGRYAIISTNISTNQLEPLKLTDNTPLTIDIAGKNYEGVFLSSFDVLTREMMQPGKVFLSKNRDDSYFVALLVGEQFSWVTPDNPKLLSEVKISTMKQGE